MTSRRGRSALLFALLLASWPMTLSAQLPKMVSIIPVQNLSFGLLVPGTRTTIAISDVARRAVVALAGSGPMDVAVILPTALETTSGDQIPLRFAPGDAALLTTAGSTVSPLDPLQINRVQLSNDRTVLFVLGGTAQTSAMTRPGHYTARVALVLTNPGT